MQGIHVRIAQVATAERALARKLLWQTVQEVTGVSASRLRLVREPAGRPRVVGTGPLHVSVSHTTGAVAVAVTRFAPVGIDVEKVRNVPAVDLARRFLAPVDVDWVAGAEPEQHLAFLWLWTHKEAIAKARGTGLRGGGLLGPVPRPDGTPWRSAVGRQLMPVPGLPDMVAAMPARLPGYALALAAQSTARPASLTVREISGLS